MRSKLQRFIEENKGKDIGGTYIYENVMLSTRHYEHFKVIEVYLSLPWEVFCTRVEYEKIDDHVKFFEWLRDIFIPEAEKNLKRKRNETDNS